MIQLSLFQFDIFGYFNTFMILGSVIAIIIFIIVIIIIYKIMHSNVNHVRSASHFKTNEKETNPYIITNKKDTTKDSTEKQVSYCEFCGAKIIEKAKYCPLCGAKVN